MFSEIAKMYSSENTNKQENSQIFIIIDGVEEEEEEVHVVWQIINTFC